jgi:hypothetical protein
MSASYKPGDTVWVEFITSRFDTGAATNADSSPAIAGTLNRNGTDDGSVTITITNIDTGRYKATFVIPATYVAGDELNLSIAATVNSVAGKGIVWRTHLGTGAIPPLTQVLCVRPYVYGTGVAFGLPITLINGRLASSTTDYTPNAGDFVVIRDNGTGARLNTLPTTYTTLDGSSDPMAVLQVTFSSSELTAGNTILMVRDNTNTPPKILPMVVIVPTYGNPSAGIPSTTVSASMDQIAGSSAAATQLMRIALDVTSGSCTSVGTTTMINDTSLSAYKSLKNRAVIWRSGANVGSVVRIKAHADNGTTLTTDTMNSIPQVGDLYEVF